MNIFVLDVDPWIAAKYHCDKHVSKMTLETAQIMCDVYHWYGYHDVPYKICNLGHPCTQWAIASTSNYVWLGQLGLALALEFETRYGKTHKSKSVIQTLQSPPPKQPDLGPSPFVQAMPDEYKNPDPVKAYRDYYRYDKKSMLHYRTKKPGWLL